MSDRNVLLETRRAIAKSDILLEKACDDVSLMAIYKIEAWILSRSRDSWESK